MKRECSVTIVARTASLLEDLCSELNEFAKERGLRAVARYVTCDLTGAYEDVVHAVQKATSELGDIDILINNVGGAVQDQFVDLPVEAFEYEMRLNYLSAVYVTKAVAQGMLKRRSGHIAFVNSAAGQCAIWGYTAYSASKFALRGFAEALSRELQPYNVGVTTIYPPNTSTEGFEEEKKQWQEEVKEITSQAGLFEPEEIAERLLDGIARGQISISYGIDGWLLTVLAAGGAPEATFSQALFQILFGGAIRAVMLFYSGKFDRIVRSCIRKRKQTVPVIRAR